MVSVNDTTLLRGHHHRTEVAINLVPNIVLATAQINQAAFTYPISQITVDNDSGLSDVTEGDMIWIGTAPGENDIAIGVIRKQPVSQTVYLDVKNLGDAGKPRDIAIQLADNQYVTVLKYKLPYGIYSSIRNGVIYKKWDIEFAFQTVNPDPIVNIGSWRQEYVGNGGTAALSFSASAHDWNSAVSTYLWDLDGGSVVTGTLNSASLTAQFNPGFYAVTCKITLANGKNTTAYRYVWINNTSPSSQYSPLNKRYIVRIVSDKQDAVGRSITIEVEGNLDSSTFFYGQAMMFREYPSFDGQSLTGNDFVDTFIGYLSEKSVSITEEDVKTTTLTFEGPLLYSKNVAVATQQLVEEDNPTNWTECSSVLSNPIGYYWYITHLHAPYLILGHDFEFSSFILQLRRKAWQWQQTELGSQLLSLNTVAVGSVGCKSDGTVRFLRSPYHLSNTDRNALDIQWTWGAGDIIGPLQKAFTIRVPVGQVFGFAFSHSGYDSVPYGSLAPGYQRSQGPSSPQMDAFTVRHQDGQTEVNRITGHQYALENRESQDFSITVDRNIDIAEPCNVDMWHRINIPASYDPDGVGYVNQRIVPVRVNRTWSQEGATTKQITVDFQVESFGLPGITVPINRGGANDWNYSWNPGLVDQFEPAFLEFPVDVPIMLAWNSEGLLARSFTFDMESVDWLPITGFLGVVDDVALDFGSPYFVSSGRLGVWILTHEGTTVRLYYVYDILADGLYINISKTYTVDASYIGKGRIISSVTEVDFNMIVLKDGTGIRYARSTAAYPHSWSVSLTYIGSSLSPIDTAHANNEVGFDINDEVQCVIAPNGSTLGDGTYDYRVYYASTKTGSFSALPNFPTNETAQIGGLHLPSTGVVTLGTRHSGTPTPPSALQVVDFDTSTKPGYTITSGAGVTIAFGNPQPAAYNSKLISTGADFNGIAIRLDLQDRYTFRKITFDSGLSGPSLFGGYYSVYVAFYDATLSFIGAKDFITYDWFKESISYEEFAPEYTGRDEIRYIEITLARVWDIADSSAIHYIWIDNIDVTSALWREDEAYLKLRRATVPGGSWSDATPQTPSVPKSSYGIVSAGTKYTFIGEALSGQTYLFDGTSGTTWVRLGKTKLLGSKRSADLLIAFGYSSLVVSLDGGRSAFSRLGNWASAVGSIGEIRGVAGVL